MSALAEQRRWSSLISSIVQDDAAKIVQYCKYPPLGSRGYGPAFSPHSFPGLKAGATYEQGANEAIKVMVQIESREGVDNVEKIAQVKGLDVLLIGECLNDLTDCVNRNSIEAAHADPMNMGNSTILG
jgi:2-keto-3-deoxy-L-rhamnonate aldolase RhmA